MARLCEQFPGFRPSATEPRITSAAAACCGISFRSWWAPPAPCALWSLRPPRFLTGLWCYRLDPGRALLGGALSNGGEVYAWLKRTLALPKDTEARLEAAEPGGHGLTVLPFFAGERSPYWRADLRGVIAGLSLSTEPFDILHASLESVALRFREIYGALSAAVGSARRSHRLRRRAAAFARLDADDGGHAGPPCGGLYRARSVRRGAALYALERIGAIPNLEVLPASTGAIFSPRPQFEPVYARLLEEQRGLYDRLFGPHL